LSLAFLESYVLAMLNWTRKSGRCCARELGVQYVLEGSVRRDAGTVRITAQLIQAKDQTHLWTQEYDRQLKDLLVLQGQVAQAVANEIRLTFADRRRLAPPSALSNQEYEAYDLYLRGRYFWNQRTSQGLEQATEYAGLADAYAMLGIYGFAPRLELIPKARAAALKALELNPNLAEAHTSLALIAQDYDWDGKTAEREYRRAIELDPNYATAHWNRKQRSGFDVVGEGIRATFS
jgi:tetratricopeptide (TPR) repeat protein